MSKKIKQNKAELEQVYTIDDIEMKYLTDLDTVQRSVDFYFNQLKTNYIQQIALKVGYSPEDQLEFSIDLKDEKKELTITRVK